MIEGYEELTIVWSKGGKWHQDANRGEVKN